MERQEEKYLKLLKEKYPTRQSVCREIINLEAILNLPKGTEHFMSDLHGEYESFLHILNNCSGVIKEKVDFLFSDLMAEDERKELCTLIYYPREKLAMYHEEKADILSEKWYERTLSLLVQVAKMLSSKYTRSKVRKAMPIDFAYIIDELLHVQKDEDDNQERYHSEIIKTIIALDNADAFIIALAALIKRLAVDHLHIVGDIFDRGGDADKIIDLLMVHHSVDIQWGNHDIIWMGAASGSHICAASAVRNNLKYGNVGILENAYGISLRKLMLFAINTYKENDPVKASYKAISIIMFKLEGRIVKRHPEYEMDDRLFLDKLDLAKGVVNIDGKEVKLKSVDFPTVDPANPYCLTEEEKEIVENLSRDFTSSERLQRHVAFLYKVGGIYKVFNGNLLYHGCIPMEENGNFATVNINNEICHGKALFDRSEYIARKAFSDEATQDDLDYMWFLWGAEKSPICGRRISTFERMFIADENYWAEPANPYYRHYFDENVCDRILREFALYDEHSHIINGHTPVRALEGEKPVRAGGKLLVIDGGFCRPMNRTTGIAGYTLIFNSHGLRIKAHHPFESVRAVLTKNMDIESDSELIEALKSRVMVMDTDAGKKLSEEIEDLKKLLVLY